MGLDTDKLFIEMLQADETLMQQIGGRLYGTAIPMPDEDADNVPVPYVVITFDGLTNGDSTKDMSYDANTDTVQIGVTVCAENREQLAELTRRIRRTIFKEMQWLYAYAPLADREHVLLEDRNSFHLKVVASEDYVYSHVPFDYRFSAQAVQFDSLKPCYWQVLNYSCDVQNDFIYEDDDEQEGNESAEA